MQTIRIKQKTESDGSLSLRIPLGQPETDYDVLVVLEPCPKKESTPEGRGWPPGYFEKTYGSIDDETFMRHPQGEWPKPVELD